MAPFFLYGARRGTIIGHISAKGLHTNLLLQVAVSEDCRFAFAGCLRGSAQMLAWDLSTLPTWSTYDRKAKVSFEATLQPHVHSDAKLKGFGGCTRLLPSPAAASSGALAAAAAALPPGTPVASEKASCTTVALTTPSAAKGFTDEKVAATSEQKAEYLLICGRGIKNIHIWSFKVGSGEGCAEEPSWSLVHDIPTNGMTLELIGFRKHGAQAYSRSKGYGLRVWNLPPPRQQQQQLLLEGGHVGVGSRSATPSPPLLTDESASSSSTDSASIPPTPRALAAAAPGGGGSSAKLVHVDVPASNDVMAVSGSYAFGGEYALSVIKLPADSTSEHAEGGSPRNGGASISSTSPDDASWRHEVALPDEVEDPNYSDAPPEQQPKAEPRLDQRLDKAMGRKRKVVRALVGQRVLPCEDASVALLVCSDGTCLRYDCSQQAGSMSTGQEMGQYVRWQASDEHGAVFKLCGVPGNIAFLAADWCDRDREGTLTVRPLEAKKLDASSTKVISGNTGSAAALKEGSDKEAAAAFWAAPYVNLWPIGSNNTVSKTRASHDRGQGGANSPSLTMGEHDSPQDSSEDNDGNILATPSHANSHSHSSGGGGRKLSIGPTPTLTPSDYLDSSTGAKAGKLSGGARARAAQQVRAKVAPPNSHHKNSGGGGSMRPPPSRETSGMDPPPEGVLLPHGSGGKRRSGGATREVLGSQLDAELTHGDDYGDYYSNDNSSEHGSHQDITNKRDSNKRSKNTTGSEQGPRFAALPLSGGISSWRTNVLARLESTTSRESQAPPPPLEDESMAVYDSSGVSGKEDFRAVVAKHRKSFEPLAPLPPPPSVPALTLGNELGDDGSEVKSSSCRAASAAAAHVSARLTANWTSGVNDLHESFEEERNRLVEVIVSAAARADLGRAAHMYAAQVRSEGGAAAVGFRAHEASGSVGSAGLGSGNCSSGGGGDTYAFNGSVLCGGLRVPVAPPVGDTGGLFKEPRLPPALRRKQQAQLKENDAARLAATVHLPGAPLPYEEVAFARCVLDLVHRFEASANQMAGRQQLEADALYARQSLMLHAERTRLFAAQKLDAASGSPHGSLVEQARVFQELEKGLAQLAPPQPTYAPPALDVSSIVQARLRGV